MTNPTPLHFILGLFLLIGTAGAHAAAKTRQHQCRAGRSATEISLPMGAFAMSDIPGTCKLIATLGGDEDKATGGLALIDLTAAAPRLERIVATPSAAIGLTITRDRRLAIVAGTDRVYIFDLASLLSGKAERPAEITYAKEPGTVSVALTPDERLLFASDEGAGKISVLDFAAMRRSHFSEAKLLSSIPVDFAPTVIAISPNGRLLYVPVEGISRRFNPPVLCRSEGGDDATPINPVGGILTIDVALAVSHPNRAVLTRTPAGCSPVRLSMSRDGRTVWVTNRLGDTARAFDATKLARDPAHAQRAVVSVGHQPIGITLLDDERLVAVANASRWEPDQTSPKTMSVFDSSTALAGKYVAAKQFPVGIFPRDLATSADGETLYVSNFGSKSISLIPVAQLRPRR